MSSVFIPMSYPFGSFMTMCLSSPSSLLGSIIPSSVRVFPVIFTSDHTFTPYF